MPTLLPAHTSARLYLGSLLSAGMFSCMYGDLPGPQAHPSTHAKGMNTHAMWVHAACMCMFCMHRPTMMGEAEVKAAVEAVVSELGATTQKDMGKVMVALKVRPSQLQIGSSCLAWLCLLVGYCILPLSFRSLRETKV